MEAKRLLATAGFFVIAFSLVMPAYADVVTFKTDKTFYGKTGSIIFSGTVEEDDYGELVTIVIEDPIGNFAKLISVFPDIDNKFEKSVKIEEWYTTAGIYNATAFIVNKTSGMVIDFDIEKQRPVVTPEPEPEPEPVPEEDSTPVSEPEPDTETQEDEKTIQEKIQERIEAAKKLKESQTGTPVLGENSTNTGSTNDGTTSEDNSNDTKTSTGNPIGEIDLGSNLLYIIAGVGGAGAAGAAVYVMRNNRHKPDYSSYFTQPEKTESVQKPTTQSEDDYALMILKNRLAKGEITVDEFNERKKALKEP